MHPYFKKMTLIRQLIAVLALCSALAAGCRITTDMSANPRSMTDFEIDAIYELVKPAYLTEDRLFLDKTADARGVCDKGTRFVVTRIESVRSSITGKRVQIWARIQSGELKGREVDVFYLADGNLTTGYTALDRGVLKVLRRK